MKSRENNNRIYNLKVFSFESSTCNVEENNRIPYGENTMEVGQIYMDIRLPHSYWKINCETPNVLELTGWAGVDKPEIKRTLKRNECFYSEWEKMYVKASWDGA